MRNHLMTLVLLLAAAGSASAREPTGAYVGAGASIAFEEFDLPRGVDADDTATLDLIAGYRVSPFVAIEGEAQFLYLTGFDLDGIGGDIDGVSLTGSAKVFPVPQSEGLEPFLLAGIGLLDLEGPHRIHANETNWMYQLGGGLNFPIGQETLFEVNAAYHFPQGHLDDFEYWTVGANVQYRF